MQGDELTELLTNLISASVIYNGQNIAKNRIDQFAYAISGELSYNFPKDALTFEFCTTVMQNGMKEYYGDSNPYPKNVINWFRTELTRKQDEEHERIKSDERSKIDPFCTDKARVIKDCFKLSQMGYQKEVDYTRALDMEETEQNNFITCELERMVGYIKKHGTVEPYLKEIRELI